MKSVHYIRFAQALIIAAVPACTAAVESKNPEPETSTAVAASSAKPEGTAAAQSDAQMRPTTMTRQWTAHCPLARDRLYRQRCR
jgi:hypothetical protein